jgi:hypothetical protein
METRLSSSVQAAALIRRVQLDGGFAAVLVKGDADAGAIIVVLTEKGRNQRVLERALQADGHYMWQDALLQVTESKSEFENYLERRRKYDPDLWLIELDVASAERFAAEMNRKD